MAEITLEVERRTDLGKNACRRLRKVGTVPAIVYGGGRDSVPIQVNRREMVVRLESGAGENSVFLLRVKGSKDQRHTMIRNVQIDPISRRVEHVDFQRIEMSEKVTIKVEVELLGTAVGVKTDGGIIEFITRELEVECLPTNIPNQLTLDISGLHLGHHLEAREVPLPEGVVLLDDPERVIVLVAAPAVAEEEEEDEDGLLEGGVAQPIVTSAKDDGEEEEDSD